MEAIATVSVFACLLFLAIGKPNKRKWGENK